MSNCLFCKIAAGEISSNKVFETDECFAFHDIAPQAPTHILIIPKIHITNLSESEDHTILGKLLEAAKQIAKKENLEDFRVVINNGAGAGQTVFHLHIHLLAGRPFSWPPG